MQLLIYTSYHFFKYNTIIADWDVIENSTNTPDVLFAWLAIDNLYYNLFGKYVDGFSLFSICNIFKDLVVGIYYK